MTGSMDTPPPPWRPDSGSTATKTPWGAATRASEQAGHQVSPEKALPWGPRKVGEAGDSACRPFKSPHFLGSGGPAAAILTLLPGSWEVAASRRPSPSFSVLSPQQRERVTRCTRSILDPGKALRIGGP